MWLLLAAFWAHVRAPRCMFLAGRPTLSPFFGERRPPQAPLSCLEPTACFLSSVRTTRTLHPPSVNMAARRSGRAGRAGSYCHQAGRCSSRAGLRASYPRVEPRRWAGPGWGGGQGLGREAEFSRLETREAELGGAGRGEGRASPRGLWGKVLNTSAKW